MTSKEESGHATGEVKEVEVLLAEMETRLRSVILSIIRPSLDRAHDLDTRLKDLGEEVAGHESALFTVDKLRAEVGQQKEFTASLGEQIHNRDQLSREFEHRTGNDLQDIRMKVEMLEQRQEELLRELRQQVRDAQRTWSETQHLAEHHETSMRQVYEHISAGEKKGAQAREEIIYMVRELQKNREDLLEDLFGEEKGITKLGHDLAKVFRITASIPSLTNSLAVLSDKIETLDVKEAKVETQVSENENEFHAFTEDIQVTLRLMKEEFRQDRNRLIAHNATLMKDIRQDYIDEMMAVAKVRTEIMQFQTNIDTICRDIAEALEKETRRIDALHRELVEDIEEIQRRRKKRPHQPRGGSPRREAGGCDGTGLVPGDPRQTRVLEQNHWLDVRGRAGRRCPVHAGLRRPGLRALARAQIGHGPRPGAAPVRRVAATAAAAAELAAGALAGRVTRRAQGLRAGWIHSRESFFRRYTLRP
jgi:hypothetical protein